jgi:phenylalanine ammonia-lyase
LTGQRRNGKPIKIDGRTLSIAAITAASHYLAEVELDSTPATRDIGARFREVIEERLSNGVFEISANRSQVTLAGPN